MRLLPVLLLAATASQAQTTAPAHKEVLLQADHSWNGTAYTRYAAGQPQLTTLKLTLPAHTALPWHTHPCPNAGYVVSGALTIEDPASGKHQTFHQGEAFAETVDDVHRGKTGDAPVTLIITYACVSGQPTSVPVKGQASEY